MSVGGKSKGLAPIMVPPLLIGLIIVGLLLWLDSARADLREGLLITDSTIWGRDFANVWSGGRMLLDGQPLSLLYDIEGYQQWQRDNLDPGIDNHNYSYPPTSLLYAWAFGAMPYVVAMWTWLALSAAAFFAAARPWLKEAGIGPRMALLLPTSLLCLWAGHYGLFFGALWLIAWRSVDSDQRISGIATGLMIIKPHLALLMPLLFVLKGAWRAFAWAALTVGALVALSAAIFGPTLWDIYLTRTSGVQLSLIDNVGTYFALMMPSTVTNAMMMGASPALAWSLQGIVALIAFIALLKLPRTAPALCFGGAIATFLMLPYGFNYDLTVVGLAALLIGHHVASSWKRFTLLVTGLVLMLAPAMLWLGRWDIHPAPIILLALMFVLVRQPQLLAAASRSN